VDGLHIGVNDAPSPRLIPHMCWDGDNLRMHVKNMYVLKSMQVLFWDNYRRFYWIKSSTIRSRMLQRSLIGAFETGELLESELDRMGDGDVASVLKKSSCSLTRDLAERLFGQDASLHSRVPSRSKPAYVTAAVWKLEGYLGTELVDGKAIYKASMTPEEKARFMEVPVRGEYDYTHHEQALEKVLGLEPGEVLLCAQRDMGTVENPKDVLLYSAAGKGGTLFNRMPWQRTYLEALGKDIFSVRLAVPPSKRDYVFGKAAATEEYMRNEVFKSPET